MRRILLLLLLLAIVVLAAGAATGYHLLLRPGPARTVEVRVSQGASVTVVLQDLRRLGLLPSVVAGKVYVRFFRQGRSLHFGQYLIPPRSRPAAVLERILDGQVETVEVTIVEGLTADETGERFAVAGIGDPQQWRDVVQRAEWVHSVAPAATSLEGFLFPETYRFSVGSSVEAVARHLVERFCLVWNEEVALARQPWGTPLEVVTLASLVEAETSLGSERARVAGVFLNRLSIGMPLQCDPTVVYALKQRGEWQGQLLRLHWQVDHPYNTYRYPGLPPGPICSPGRTALRAALHPEKHTYLYFVASPGGGHTFSRTLREHNQAVARLRRSRK